MKALIQKVSAATVTVRKRTVGTVGRGLVLFLGIDKGDDVGDIDYLCRKVTHLRIFSDEQGKMNLSVRDINGGVLVVSQFTLSGDCRKGNRPSFDNAELPLRAEELYNKFIEKLTHSGIHVATGQFGEWMEVSLVNDGPVTFMLDSRK